MNLARKLDLHKIAKFIVIISIALILSFLINSIWQKNEFDLYPLSRLKWVPIIAVPLFVVSWLASRRLLPAMANLMDRQEFLKQVVLCSLTALVIIWFWPPAVPAWPTSRTLKIESLNEKNPAASGTVLEILKVRNADGSPIPVQKFHLSGDWNIKGDSLVAQGNMPGATAEYSGPVSGGILLDLHYNLDAGKMKVSLDGEDTTIDLYSERGITYQIPLGVAIWQNASGLQQALTGLAMFFQIIGLAILVFILELLSRRQWRFYPLLIAVIFAVILWSYLGIKLSYSKFNAGRAFRDTSSYVEVAEKTLTSREFWAGNRPFTLPLVYKLLHINTSNYTGLKQLKAVEAFQNWFSVVCWALLGLALAATMRHRWTAALIFAFVLFFSISLEVSFWDSLLLSKSVSFSLFALLIAAWVGLGLLPQKIQSSPIGWIYLIGMLMVTVLYSFTREANLYFVLAGSGILLLVTLLGRFPAGDSRKYVFVYTACVIGLFIFQNLTIEWGNRWQIHFYDHLALRILRDPQSPGVLFCCGSPHQCRPDGNYQHARVSISRLPGLRPKDGAGPSLD